MHEDWFLVVIALDNLSVCNTYTDFSPIPLLLNQILLVHLCLLVIPPFPPEIHSMRGAGLGSSQELFVYTHLSERCLLVSLRCGIANHVFTIVATVLASPCSTEIRSPVFGGHEYQCWHSASDRLLLRWHSQTPSEGTAVEV